MRLPRKGILIRLLIYVPLIGFLAWRAFSRPSAEETAAAAEQARQERMQEILNQQTQSITLPDGTVQRVPVITPEQAEELWGVPPARSEGKAAAQADKPAPTPAPSNNPE